MTNTTIVQSLILAAVLIVIAMVLAAIIGHGMMMNDDAEKAGAAHAAKVAKMEAKSHARTCKDFPLLKVCSK